MKYEEFVDNLAAPSQTELEKLLHSVVGIAGESGELLDCLKKVCWQQHELDRDKLIDELGDILFYFTYTCNNIRTTIEEVREKNIEKLTKRYPGGKFDKNRSINRDEK